MVRKDRSLAGFGDVASENNPTTNGQTNNNDNASVNINNKGQKEQPAGGGDPDFLDKLLEEGKKKKKDDLVLTGIYLQPDLAHILDSLGKKGGRGAKSRIVNDALRKVFTEKGLL